MRDEGWGRCVVCGGPTDFDGDGRSYLYCSAECRAAQRAGPEAMEERRAWRAGLRTQVALLRQRAQAQAQAQPSTAPMEAQVASQAGGEQVPSEGPCRLCGGWVQEPGVAYFAMGGQPVCRTCAGNLSESLLDAAEAVDSTVQAVRNEVNAARAMRDLRWPDDAA